MTSSLVGSEMCIRDSFSASGGTVLLCLLSLRSGASSPFLFSVASRCILLAWRLFWRTTGPVSSAGVFARNWKLTNPLGLQ
eukprot:3183436-Prorocentrum_lima.AAC.1